MSEANRKFRRVGNIESLNFAGESKAEENTIYRVMSVSHSGFVDLFKREQLISLPLMVHHRCGYTLMVRPDACIIVCDDTVSGSELASEMVDRSNAVGRLFLGALSNASIKSMHDYAEAKSLYAQGVNLIKRANDLMKQTDREVQRDEPHTDEFFPTVVRTGIAHTWFGIKDDIMVSITMEGIFVSKHGEKIVLPPQYYTVMMQNHLDNDYGLFLENAYELVADDEE